MNPLDYKLADLINSIHHAVEIPAHWEVFLKDMATGLKATKASMHRHSFAAQMWDKHTAGSRLFSFGYDDAAAAAYAKHYAVRDIYVQRIREQFRGPCVGTSDDLLSADELRRTSFYAGYARPNGIFFVGFAAVEQNDEYGSGLAFVRPEDAKQFSRNDVELLRFLIPPLAQAFKNQCLIDDLVNRNRFLLNGLAEADVCAVALDSSGRIVDLSPPAQTLLDKREGIEVRDGKLRATRTEDNFKLQNAFNLAVHALDMPRSTPKAPVFLVRPNHQTPLRVTASRVASCSARGALLGLYRPWVLVRIVDPSANQLSVEAWLRTRYKLAPTLCRFAQLFREGHRINVVADRMNITLETARSYRKKVMTATKTRQQAELMKLLLRPDDQTAG